MFDLTKKQGAENVESNGEGNGVLLVMVIRVMIELMGGRNPVRRIV
jgi:hypothetical protein